MPEGLRRAKREDHPHIARALAAREPMVLADITQTEMSAAERVVVEQRRLRSLIFFPFSHEGAPVGILILGTQTEQRRFGAHEIVCCASPLRSPGTISTRSGRRSMCSESKSWWATARGPSSSGGQYRTSYWLSAVVTDSTSLSQTRSRLGGSISASVLLGEFTSW
jgi:hypothetical protein